MQFYILILSLLLIILGWLNILSTKVFIHTNTKPIFEKYFDKNYENFLNNKHKLLCKFYDNAKYALNEKVRMNNTLYFWTAIFIIIILIIFNTTLWH
jgi:hypothetical protein